MGWGTYPNRVKNEGFLNATLKQEQPEMSDAETALLDEQVKSLRAQQVITANQFHYKINDNGSWSKMSDDEWYAQAGESEKQQYDAYRKQLTKYNQAMEGELPLTRGMQTQKEEEFQGLKSMGNIAGANLETAQANDTIGIQRLGEMQKRWAQIKEEQSLQAMGMGGNLQQGQNLAGLGTMNPGNISNSQGWQAVMQPYQMYNMAGYQAKAQDRSNAIGLIGTLAGMYAGSRQGYRGMSGGAGGGSLR
jgi:hypothetical protein